MPAANLTAIPLELFETIAQDVARKDLKSLRLVSSEANSKVLTFFSKTFFPHQAFYLNSQKSLELAVEVTRHAAFAPAIKTISLCIEEVHIRASLSSEIEGARKARLRAVEAGADITAYARIEEGLIKYRKALEEEKSFQSSGAQTALLRQIFINLAEHGNLSRLELTDRATSGRDPLVLPGMEGFVYRTPLALPACRDGAPFTLVSEALEHARSQASTPRELLVSTLVVCTKRWALPGRHLNKLSQFNGIQYLDITVCGKGSEAQFAPFIKSLEHAAGGSLKSLNLKVTVPLLRGTYRHTFSTPFLDAVFPEVETLSISGGSFVIKELAQFVKRQPRLGQLDLKGLVLVVTKKERKAMEKEGLEALIGVKGTYQSLIATKAKRVRGTNQGVS
ncbi:hypothetical protein CLAFUW4_14693 [Fulvia fulva]|uniref:F-box domain-containing protein n=1 Tax=Passalora fulva TaxID=5499 RepID=A0A9Q8PLT2_PASFU|nr:uncharacterized protein CLAFUR5_14521 [Fulvia fulva]KAK4609162.1 hypothetical protein CLAFUR4_14685 [Fulvia fulva]KAK4609932.1 hypothetical protein CLAFUR0_14685 [Fulvia fulva]UJO24891.1 hypothetical protein CLAFUR5_14521 [Fulvia fulva]WPV22562.1 hypothetical protein CLAFUW4_14693 [Fulvia fulva]WPV37918.1 hypothetical protein CLAFUW7_14694 [Fulvia fulva]